MLCENCGMELARNDPHIRIESGEIYCLPCYDKDKGIRRCSHDHLFEAVAVEPKDVVGEKRASEIKGIYCCNKCGGYMVVQEVAQGESAWMAYPSEYPELYE